MPATHSCGSHSACGGQALPEATATRAAPSCRYEIRKNSLGACASSSGMAKPNAKGIEPEHLLEDRGDWQGAAGARRDLPAACGALNHGHSCC